jgi:tetratricopeptide (TPR) repeat protein
MSIIKNLILFFNAPHEQELRFNNVRLIFFLLITFCGNAQDEAQLSMSNKYIFEGNSIVKDNFIEAEKKYRLGVSAKPNNTVGSYNLANAYYNSKLYDEAMLRLLEAVKNSDSKLEKHSAYHNIGNTLMQQKRCKEAVSAYKNALRNNSADNETRYNLALAQECAKEQGNSDSENDEKDKGKDNEDKENSDEKKENENKNKDKKGDNEDKKEGNDKEDEDGKPKNDNGNQKNKDPNNDKGQPKPRPGMMSAQQVKNLLEAMNNEEKKVQEKMNASKTKGIKVQSEKDW